MNTMVIVAPTFDLNTEIDIKHDDIIFQVHQVPKDSSKILNLIKEYEIDDVFVYSDSKVGEKFHKEIKENTFKNYNNNVNFTFRETTFKKKGM